MRNWRDIAACAEHWKRETIWQRSEQNWGEIKFGGLHVEPNLSNTLKAILEISSWALSGKHTNIQIFPLIILVRFSLEVKIQDGRQKYSKFLVG